MGLVGLLALLASGCVGAVDLPETFLFSGDLVPAADADVPIFGSMAVIVQRQETILSIGLEGALEGETFGWMVRTGRCDGAGEPVVSTSLPPLTVSEEGTASMDVIMQRRLDGNVSYAGEVFANPDGTGTVLACADLGR